MDHIVKRVDLSALQFLAAPGFSTSSSATTPNAITPVPAATLSNTAATGITPSSPLITQDIGVVTTTHRFSTIEDFSSRTPATVIGPSPTVLLASHLIFIPSQCVALSLFFLNCPPWPAEGWE